MPTTIIADVSLVKSFVCFIRDTRVVARADEYIIVES